MAARLGYRLTLGLSLSGLTFAYLVKVDMGDKSIRSFDIPAGNLTADEFLAHPGPVIWDQSQGSNLTERDCNPIYTHYYELNGDGDPHQNYKIAQIAKTEIECPGSISTGESHTFGWSFSGSTNPGVKAGDFAALGFSVSSSETNTVTETFDCSNGQPGDGTLGGESEICAMHYTAVTALSVTFYTKVRGCGEGDTYNMGTGTVYLPNANDAGSIIGKGVNFAGRNIIQCRGQAEREIDYYCGPKGGPEWFGKNTPGPWTDAYMAQREPKDCTMPIEAIRFCAAGFTC